jgi:conjugal transfer pilus assembly protein TrbC
MEANAVEHYVFISLSMPKPSIKQLLEQSKELDAQVVLRGFINNSHKTTAEFMQDLVTTTQYGLIVDPELFSKYKVTEVPTFVIADDGKYDKLSGNISWHEAIKIIKKRGDVYATE